MDDPQKAMKSTKISWRDELSYSHDVKSEGLEKLKEAIKIAKAVNSDSEPPAKDT